MREENKIRREKEMRGEKENMKGKRNEGKGYKRWKDIRGNRK